MLDKDPNDVWAADNAAWHALAAAFITVIDAAGEGGEAMQSPPS